MNFFFFLFLFEYMKLYFCFCSSCIFFFTLKSNSLISVTFKLKPLNLKVDKEKMKENWKKKRQQQKPISIRTLFIDCDLNEQFNSTNSDIHWDSTETNAKTPTNTMKSTNKMLCLVNLPNGTTFGIQCDPKAIGQKCLEEVSLLFVIFIYLFRSINWMRVATKMSLFCKVNMYNFLSK